MNFNDNAELPGAYWTEIAEERKRQVDKGFTLSKVAVDGADELEKTLKAYISWAGQMSRMGSPDRARRRLLQVATMCLSRMQVLDAAPRNLAEELEETRANLGLNCPQCDALVLPPSPHTKWVEVWMGLETFPCTNCNTRLRAIQAPMRLQYFLSQVSA